jgi:uncharacterized protein (DUF58 family)
LAKKKVNSGNSDFYDLLAQADDTYAELPPELRLEIERLANCLMDAGLRRLRQKGRGFEIFGTHEYRKGDPARDINPRLTARKRKPIVIEWQKKIPHHFYLWRSATPLMKYASSDLHTKKQAAEIMLLALAKHLAKNEELIGILDQKGVYRHAQEFNSAAENLADVSVITGDMPSLSRKLPRNSTAVLFSDFWMDPDTLTSNLDNLTGTDLNGFMVMVLDPQELEFDFRGSIEFNAPGEKDTVNLKKAESLRDKYKSSMNRHINDIKQICENKGFTFIMQRTDKPLHHALLKIYGLPADTLECTVEKTPEPAP